MHSSPKSPPRKSGMNPVSALARLFAHACRHAHFAAACLGLCLQAVASAQEEETPGRDASFSIRLEAPGEVRELLEPHLELERYRHIADLDRAELERLLALSAANIRELLAAQGYFAPVIDHRVSAPGPAEGEAERPEVAILVDPGERTRVTQVHLDFSGEIAAYAPARGQLADIRSGWGLAEREHFTQEAWSAAKAGALRRLQTLRFPAARLAASEAEIDPDTSSAHLRVDYESGPAYRLGPVHVEGARRYDATIAERLARLREGDDYDQRALLDAQQRLIDSGYYRSAFIGIETAPGTDPQAAPVRVEVEEARQQKLVLGVGASTDRGPRASLEHAHNAVPLLGWRATTKIEVDKIVQNASLTLLAPPDERLWRHLLAATERREEIDDYRLDTLQVRAGRTKLEGGIDRTWYLQYDHSRKLYSEWSDTSAQAVSANYVWTYRRFDSLTDPRSGFGVALEAGGGTTLSPAQYPFTRLLGRYQGFFPLDGDIAAGVRRALPLAEQIRAIAAGDAEAPSLRPSALAATDTAGETQAAATRRNGEIVLRLEAAAVFAHDAAPIPAGLLFLTGGDATVRGYGYHEIGVAGDNGQTDAGRYLMVGSIEYRRPVMRAGRPTEWDALAFVDAGAVADQPGQLHAKVGAGIGALWRSPVGPVQMAVAYGLQSESLRLHMNLGFNF